MATKLKLDLVVDDKGSVVVKKFGKTAQGAMNVAKAGAVGLGVGLAGMTAGLYAANRVMSEAVGLANVQEKAEAKLGAILKSTGNAAGFNSDQLKAMASGLQKVTTVGDETIINGMAILATFKGVQKEAFERTTAVALDMSNVMGTDLRSSMVQLGKALNDPAKGLSMLTRVGVTFTDEQKHQITVLQESGDVMGAQAVMLQELESEFGGAAKAARETFGGAVEAMNNTLGDTKEELGFVITKNQLFVDLVKLAEGEFARWGTQIKDNRQYLSELAKSGIVSVIGGLETALEVMRFFHNGWLGLKYVGSMVTEALADALWFVAEAVRAVLFPFDELFKFLVKVGKMDSNPFDALTEGAERFRYSSEDVKDQVAKDIRSTNKAYDSAGKKIGAMKKAISAIPVTSTKATNKQIKNLKEIAKVVGLTEKERKKADKEAEKARKKAASDENKLAKDRADAYRRMFNDMGRSGTQYFKQQKDLLDKEKDEYSKLIDDKAMIDEWAASKYRDLEKEKLLATGNFVDGVRVGYMNLEDQQRTWAQGGLAAFESMTRGMETAFSDLLYDALTGDMQDFQSYFDSFYKSLLRTVTDTVAEMAVQWAVSEGVNFLAGMLDFHSGAWEIKDDEVVAKLQKGEMVIPKDRADQIRDTFGGGGGFGATVGGGVSPGTMSAAAQHGLDTFGSMAKGRGTAAGIAVATGEMDISQALGTFAQGVPGMAVAGLSDALAKSLGIDPAPGKATDLATTMSGILGSIVGGPLGLAIGRIVGAIIAEGMFGTNMGGYGGFQGLGIGTPSSYSGTQGAGIGMGGHGGFQGLGIGNPSSYGGNNDAAADAGGDDGGADFGGAGDGETGWRYGGISRGPKTGHVETLHGTEAVVPLPNGRSIPVEMNGGGGPVFVNRGIITTDDVRSWFANVMKGTQDGRVGNQYQVLEAVEAGIDI